MEIVNIGPTHKMGNSTIFEIVLYFLFLSICTADTACLPVLTRKTNDTLQRGDNEVLLCEKLSCKTLNKVIYEKTDITSPSIWTPVYEAINSSHHHALVTGSDYTLHDRADHDTVHSHFLLKLRDITVKDNGRWRCVVVDKHFVRHESVAVPLTVVPENDVTIKSKTPELVAGQSETFTCEINGIYPKPRFEWVLNNTKHPGNTTRYELRDDGLWYAANTVAKMEFDEPGKAVLMCAVTTLNGDPLVRTNITVDVKAPARITFPKEELLITADGTSPVIMTCSGTGYRPRIIWTRNGFDIRSDNQQHISPASDTSMCTSTLTLTPIDPPLTCQKVRDFAGNYTCTVTLNPFYESKKTSKPTIVNMLHKPLLKEQPKTVFIGESKTATLRCEVCSSTQITSKWTFNGEILHGPNVEHQEDGSMILTGYHPSGAYNRTVQNQFGSFSCLVDVVTTVVKRRPSIAQSLRWRGRQQCKDDEYEMVRTVLDIQYPDSPNSAIFKNPFEMEEQICSIWRSTQSDCVFVGGHTRPSITVISSVSHKTSHRLPQGTSIIHGLFINTTTHVINVYDATWNKHSIYCVDIDSLSTAELTLNAILKLSHGMVEPSCIFAINTSSIGIYCARKRMIDVFDITFITRPSHVNTVMLTGYDADKNDSVCVNPDGHICVLSYKYRNVYIYNTQGEFIYNFNTGMWYDPVHMQRLSNNTLVVVNLYGEIHRFDEDSQSSIISLGENTYVQAAVFTSSLLWVIDALDSTRIHVFKTSIK